MTEKLKPCRHCGRKPERPMMHNPKLLGVGCGNRVCEDREIFWGEGSVEKWNEANTVAAASPPSLTGQQIQDLAGRASTEILQGLHNRSGLRVSHTVQARADLFTACVSTIAGAIRSALAPPANVATFERWAVYCPKRGIWLSASVLRSTVTHRDEPVLYPKEMAESFCLDANATGYQCERWEVVTFTLTGTLPEKGEGDGKVQ